MNPQDQWREQSLADPEGFWGGYARTLYWHKPWEKVFDDIPVEDELAGMRGYTWFAGGECNTCYNALDRHVLEGRGERIALYYDSPVTANQRQYTYKELQLEVARVAGVLQSLGVTRGDRVVIYMPMIPQGVMAMLACARIGAIHSVVFGGFAADQLAKRIEHAHPKLVISASCGIEPGRLVDYYNLLNQALELVEHKPQHCLIYMREQHEVTLKEGRDHLWQEVVPNAKPADCVPVPSHHPLYILYTSGTTGMPKGVVRDTGGHMVALAFTMQRLYALQPGDVFWSASDIGWVVGHSYIVYAPLIHGCASVLYEGKPVGTPDAGAFWRVIGDYGVKALFTAPTTIRAIKREDQHADLLDRYDISSLEALFLAGERADPDTVVWAQQRLGVLVTDHWWQTETGWAIAGNCRAAGEMPTLPGSAGKVMPGYQVEILNEKTGKPEENGQLGEVAIRLPMPPGNLYTLWRDDARFHKSYLETFPGYYRTGDAGFMDENGYISIMARSDGIINVAGHRLTTGGLEEVLAGVPEVAECAVIGAKDAVKGLVPVGLVVLKKGVAADHAEVAKKGIAMVRERFGPVASFHRLLVVDRLPKTRSGKILRATIASIIDGEPYQTPPTIDDPAILNEIAAVVALEMVEK